MTLMWQFGATSLQNQTMGKIKGKNGRESDEISFPLRCCFQPYWNTDLVSQGAIVRSHGDTLGPHPPVTNIRPDKTNKVTKKREEEEQWHIKHWHVQACFMCYCISPLQCIGLHFPICLLVAWFGDTLAIAQSHLEFSLFYWLLKSAKMLWWMTGSPHGWIPAKGWACLDCLDPISLMDPPSRTLWKTFFWGGVGGGWVFLRSCILLRQKTYGYKNCRNDSSVMISLTFPKFLFAHVNGNALSGLESITKKYHSG